MFSVCNVNCMCSVSVMLTLCVQLCNVNCMCSVSRLISICLQALFLTGWVQVCIFHIMCTLSFTVDGLFRRLSMYGLGVSLCVPSDLIWLVLRS